MKEFILTAIILAGCTVGGLVSRFVFKMKPDNVIEEFAEKVIKNQTGIDIDLSPDSNDKSAKD